MVTELGAQTTLQDGLDHLRQEPALPGQAQIAGINLGHHVIEQARLDQSLTTCRAETGCGVDVPNGDSDCCCSSVIVMCIPPVP
jgi:hypothetical protein